MLSPEAANRKDTRTGINDMQHRHFTTIAAIIRNMRRAGDATSAFDADRVAHHFADELRATNPKFDRKRFLTACGV